MTTTTGIAVETSDPESEIVQKLLLEVQRTLRDNRLFIQKLKEDASDLIADDGEDVASPEESGLDEFEEL